MNAPADPLLAALTRYFGFDAFHKGQRAVIEDVVAGRPTVAVMPTGAGKSLCYQLPALLLEGVTVVVSPLIALMKDQVDALQARGVAAAFVNSSQSSAEQHGIIEQLTAGALDLVYVAPERFRHQAFVRALERASLALFAVDEAHCISRWGHDFRPDYARLGEVIERLRPPRILACTATATPEVRADIHGVLGLEDPSIHVAGFLRPNLFLEARLCNGDKDRERRLTRFLKRPELQSGAIIVYASTRKRVERYAAACWRALGDGAVVAYHGGMEDADRSSAQERFMSGEARVAVATNAFGMGVDRADVRAVVHIDLPRTVEGYYQEVGRAGRDREPAHCLLLYNPNDTRVHEFLIDRSHPTPGALAEVWALLQQAGPEAGVPEQAVERHLAGGEHEGLAEPALRQLGRVDAVWFDGGGWRPDPGAPADVSALGIDLSALSRHREHEHEKLRIMRRFVHTPTCRHGFILDYFGEALEFTCPGCDHCDEESSVGGVPGLLHEAPTDEELLLIRKALAGAARAEGRYGLRKIAGMLAGSRAQAVARTSLVNLSTYGILRSMGVDDCAALLNVLVDRGLCRLRGEKYPLLEITKAGWEVMQGREVPNFRPPGHLVPGSTVAKRVASLRGTTAQRPPSSEAGGVVADAGLVEALRAFRAEVARERGVPPYVVFNDRSMFGLAAARPTDEAGFLAVYGLGPGKWDRYGQQILDVLAAGGDEA